MLQPQAMMLATMMLQWGLQPLQPQAEIQPQAELLQSRLLSAISTGPSLTKTLSLNPVTLILTIQTAIPKAAEPPLQPQADKSHQFQKESPCIQISHQGLVHSFIIMKRASWSIAVTNELMFWAASPDPVA